MACRWHQRRPSLCTAASAHRRDLQAVSRLNTPPGGQRATKTYRCVNCPTRRNEPPPRTADPHRKT